MTPSLQDKMDKDLGTFLDSLGKGVRAMPSARACECLGTRASVSALRVASLSQGVNDNG